MSRLGLRARRLSAAWFFARGFVGATALAGALALAACADMATGARRLAPAQGRAEAGGPATSTEASPTPTAAADQSAQSEWSARYAALASGGGAVLRLDPQRSTVRILVFRGGRAARLGHNHVLTAPAFAGYLFLPSTGTEGAQFDLEFRLDSLDIDVPRERAALGAAFAAELTPGDIAGTRAHMLGEENLQAARFPFVRIHGAGITGEGSHFAAQVVVEMHGVQRTMPVPLTVTGLPGKVQAAGALVLRQSDFGIHPYSALGGLIAVQDAVIVDFTLVGG